MLEAHLKEAAALKRLIDGKSPVFLVRARSVTNVVSLASSKLPCHTLYSYQGARHRCKLWVHWGRHQTPGDGQLARRSCDCWAVIRRVCTLPLWPSHAPGRQPGQLSESPQMRQGWWSSRHDRYRRRRCVEAHIWSKEYVCLPIASPFHVGNHVDLECQEHEANEFV